VKASFIIFLILLSFFFGNSNNQKPDIDHYDNKEFVVVIDPGHGGRDPGAVGKYSHEADIALDISLRAGNYIEENIPNVKVIYTRTTDQFVELYRRAQIANEAHADLFISIHCNAAASSTAIGTETWIMGLHKNDANLAVAKKENASMLLEDDYENQYDGFNPNSDEAYITLSLFQDAYLTQSIDLASNVQDQFRDRLSRVDRGVKQAGFYVLWKTSMPGILIETGFISNPVEEDYLNSEEGKTYLSSAIYRAFKEYYLAYYGTSSSNIPDDPIQTNTNNNTNNHTNNTNSKAYYKVQFFTSPTKLAITDEKFKNISEVAFYEQSGMYKYVSGNFTGFEEASNHQKLIREKGFADAFLVAFQNNKRITITEAKQINN
jgi:N-acetylmuramoyl-L-alanine amidase